MELQIKLTDKFKKYNMLKLPVKAALWFTICNFLQKGISLLTLPIFTRVLSVEQYGVFSVYQSWYSIISIIVTLNLAGSVINNGLVKYENRKNEFISSLQGLSTLVTLIFFVIYIFNMGFWNNLVGLSSLFILTMFIQLLFEPAYLFWMQKSRFEFSYKKIIVVTLIISVFSPILGIISIMETSYKAEARVISYALIQICIGLFFYIIQIYKGRKIYVKEYWKFALAFNLPLIPHYLSQIILGQSDRIMISRMVGESKAAIYSVAYNLSTMMTLLINAINSSFIPTLYNEMKEKKYSPIRKSSNFLCIFMAVTISILMLIGPEIIGVLATEEYKEAIWIIPPVAASVFFTYMYTLFINVEFFFEKTQYTMIVSIIGAILNLVLNYFCIPKYGYIAAGYTTVICYVLFTIGHYFLSKKIAETNNVKEDIFDLKVMLLLSSCILMIMFLSLLLYYFTVIRYFIIGILIIILILRREIVFQYIKIAIKK